MRSAIWVAVVGHQLIDVFVADDLGQGHDVDFLRPAGERPGWRGRSDSPYGQKIKKACSCEVFDQAATIWVRAFDGPLSLAGAVKTPVFFSKLARMDILTNSKGCAAPALPS